MVPLKKSKDPIDGKKLNKLLLAIRSGNSEYLEHDINDLLKKCNWRRFDPPLWIWIFCPIMAIVTFLVGSRGPLDALLSVILTIAPFAGKLFSNIGYISFNKLRSILLTKDKSE